LNLQVEQYLGRYEAVLSKLNELMVKLRTLKNSALLRQHTPLKAKLRCKTRWTGAFQMVSRYFQIKDAIYSIVDEGDFEEYMLSIAEDRILSRLLEDMKKLWSVMKKLQDQTINLLDVRILFDRLIESFPSMSYYLAPNSNIVHSAVFESGVVKLLKKNTPLTDTESHELRSLQIETVAAVVLTDDLTIPKTKELSFAENALASYKSAKRTDSLEQYRDPSFIPPGSVMVESLFSILAYVFDDRRLATETLKIEEQMFLKANRLYWDLQLVSEVVDGDPNVEIELQ